jgi:ligand-binding sensor domain-containing protein
LICRHNGQFTAFTVSEGLPDNSVGPVVEDTHGNVWIGTAGGLSRFDNGNFKTFTVEQGLARNVIQTLYALPNGGLWVSTSAGLQSFDGNQFSPRNGPSGPVANITSLAMTPGGDMFVGTLDGLLHVDGE